MLSRRPLVLCLAVVLLSSWLAFATPALADHGQVSILESDGQLLSNPTGTLDTVRELGISTVRVSIRWQAFAPDPNSFRAPRGFKAGSPAAYAKKKWAPFDALVRAAAQDGVTVDLDLSGGAPLWGTGSGMPHTRGYPFHNWKLSGSRFGSFAHAVATRYSGNYSPSLGRLAPGASDDLPRVSFWSVLNEPNYGPDLAPQDIPHTTVPDSPSMYRALVAHVWGALKATGHGSDTVLFGELAPRGILKPGKFGMTTPVSFMRSLYCLGGNYRPLRGRTASRAGCPSTSGGSRSFAAHNPALFHAAGVSDHPYMRWFPPNQEEDQAQPKGFRQLKQNYATLATIGQLERGLGRMTGAYHSSRKLPVWITEFGYITNPPAKATRSYPYTYPTPATAAFYDNWAEYIAWKDSRIASFDQYTLQDPPPPANPQHQGFPSGLIFASGQHKAGFDAFRLPLYLPHTTASGPGEALEVWGAARPVYFANLESPGSPESVSILFKATGESQFLPLSQVSITSPEGYFDTQVNFPSSGTVELAWSYPNGSLPLAGTTVFSRTEQITVR